MKAVHPVIVSNGVAYLQIRRQDPKESQGGIQEVRKGFILTIDPLSIEPWPSTKKSFKLVWRCQQFLSEFLAKGHLPECHVRQVYRLMILVIMR